MGLLQGGKGSSNLEEDTWDVKFFPNVVRDKNAGILPVLDSTMLPNAEAFTTWAATQDATIERETPGEEMSEDQWVSIRPSLIGPAKHLGRKTGFEGTKYVWHPISDLDKVAAEYGHREYIPREAAVQTRTSSPPRGPSRCSS